MEQRKIHFQSADLFKGLCVLNRFPSPGCSHCYKNFVNCMSLFSRHAFPSRVLWNCTLACDPFFGDPSDHTDQILAAGITDVPMKIGCMYPTAIMA